MSQSHQPAPQKTVSLALQGGGSFGAFTWGVLDRLLEDGRVAIRDISGTSAGALTAVALADGLANGGPEAARAKLAEIWQAVGAEGDRAALFLQNPWQRLLGERNLDRHTTWPVLDGSRRAIAPAQNPFNTGNLIRALVEKHIDTAAIAAQDRHRVHIGATEVASGHARIFQGKEVTPEAIAASACLPELFEAVEIEGRSYWDGGYAVNPPLLPLAQADGADDLLIVQLNPDSRADAPNTASDIANRANEITFNGPLQRDVQAIERMNDLLAYFGQDRAETQDGPVRRTHLHRIMIPAEVSAKYNASAKLNADSGFLKELFAEGRKAADQWLAEKLPQVGVESSYHSRPDRRPVPSRPLPSRPLPSPPELDEALAHPDAPKQRQGPPKPRARSGLTLSLA